jgi:hypothetical protein
MKDESDSLHEIPIGVSEANINNSNSNVNNSGSSKDGGGSKDKKRRIYVSLIKPPRPGRASTVSRRGTEKDIDKGGYNGDLMTPIDSGTSPTSMMLPAPTYMSTFISFFQRTKPEPPSNGVKQPKSKHVKNKGFVPNRVRTSKYTIFTFLPKNLFEQFRSIANFYFLSLVILQMFPPFSQVSIVLTAAPVFFIVVVTAIKVSESLLFLYGTLCLNILLIVKQTQCRTESKT